MDKIKEVIDKILGKDKKSDSSDSSDSSGFTLIELLIVIAVIGILAAALLVAIDPIDKIRAGNDTKVLNDTRAIFDGANRAYTQTFNIPTSVQDVVDEGELKSIPTAPTDYTAYNYDFDAATDEFVVIGEVKSKGSRKKAGGASGTVWYVATAGGGCYTTGIPNQTTLPNPAIPLQCQ